MWDSFIDPVAGFFGQDADSQRDSLGTYADGKTYKPTFGDRFWGRADEGQQVLDDVQEAEVRDQVKNPLELAGGKYTEGMTVGQAGAQIRELERDRDRQSTQDAAMDAYYLPQAVEERRVRDQRYYDSQKENRQLRLDTLQREDRREKREDMRYNERLQLESKKDRRLAMQSLAQGIASLGAAFAL